MCHFYNPHIVRGILLQLIHSMQQNLEPFVKNPQKDFSRKRALPFSDVIQIILTMASHKMKRELYDYFSPLKKTVPYNSAFSQRRAKINDNAFPHLLAAFNNAFPFRKKMKGLHVLAFDGSDLNVPAKATDCATYIPYNSRKGGYHQVHLNALYNLLEKRFADLIIQPRAEVNEIAAACDMVDRNPLEGPSLYICDRGYEAFNLMAHITEKGHYFLIRAQEISSGNSPYHRLSLPDKDEFDIDIQFLLTRSRRTIYRKNPTKYKIINSKTRFDYIKPEDKESLYPLSFRLIKIKLDNGNFEYLLTNLPRESFRISEMKALYHLRWEIEKSFLFLKYGLCLNYFHSIKPERIYQEIYAKIILFNFTSLIVAAVPVPDRGRFRKHKYKIAFTDAIYLCKDLLLGLQEWNYIVKELQRHLTQIRPNRQYQRKIVSQRLRGFQHRS